MKFDFGLEKSRYERKFLLAAHSEKQVECVVKRHRAIMREIFEERYINNLYLDSPNLESYYDNVHGVKNRTKFRIRWYGELLGLVESPVLEIKAKQDLLGQKVSFALKPFELNHEFSTAMLHEVVRGSDIPKDIQHRLLSFEVTLLNRYRRKYFQSADHRFRMTIDKDLEFCRMSVLSNRFLNRCFDHRHVILELKYAATELDGLAMFSREFPFRVTKSSKYVSGIRAINGLAPYA